VAAVLNSNILIRRTDSLVWVACGETFARKKFLRPCLRKWPCCLIFRVPARYAG